MEGDPKRREEWQLDLSFLAPLSLILLFSEAIAQHTPRLHAEAKQHVNTRVARACCPCSPDPPPLRSTGRDKRRHRPTSLPTTMLPCRMLPHPQCRLLLPILVLALHQPTTHAWRLPSLQSQPQPPPPAAAPPLPAHQPPHAPSVPSSFLPAINLPRLLPFLLLLPSFALPVLAFPGLEDCVSESNPSYTLVTCDRSGPVEGRPKRYENPHPPQPTHF